MHIVRSCLDLAACLAGVWVLDGLPGASCVGGVRVVADGWARGRVAMQCLVFCCCRGCVPPPPVGLGM